MRKALLALALVGLVTVTGGADNPKPAQDSKEKPAALKVGDPAPALKASKWLQGEAVREFESGKARANGSRLRRGNGPPVFCSNGAAPQSPAPTALGGSPGAPRNP